MTVTDSQNYRNITTGWSPFRSIEKAANAPTDLIKNVPLKRVRYHSAKTRIPVTSEANPSKTQCSSTRRLITDSLAFFKKKQFCPNFTKLKQARMHKSHKKSAFGKRGQKRRLSISNKRLNRRFRTYTPNPSHSIEHIFRNSRGVSFEKDSLAQIVSSISMQVS